MKKTVKKTNKTVTPDFVMNLTNIDTVNDLYTEFIKAKVRNGKVISVDELIYVIDKTITETIDEIASTVAELYSCIPCNTYEVKDGAKLVFDENGNAKVVKPNIFRRFWNWLRRK